MPKAEPERTVVLPTTVDKYNSRVGRLHERPFLTLTYYAGLGKKYGVLAAMLVGYLEYLGATEPAHATVFEDGGRKVHYYALPLGLLLDDMRALLKTSLSRQTLQDKLKYLYSKRILLREQLGQGNDNTWYYAIDQGNLERFLEGETSDT